MICSSMSWPNMFDVARSKVNLYSNERSLTNRIKLLILTEPTELYMVPNFGVGLKKHIFKYNNDNVIALIQDELIEQLRLWEPGVIPEETVVKRGPNHSWDPSSEWETVSERQNVLHLQVSVVTNYGSTVTFDITNADIPGLI